MHTVINKIRSFLQKIFLSPPEKPVSIGSLEKIDYKTKRMLPPSAQNLYLHYYNREYRKYDSVKEMKKTIKLMSREEFAHKRALKLIIKSLSEKTKGAERVSILQLLEEQDIEIIEEKLQKVLIKMEEERCLNNEEARRTIESGRR